MTYFIYEPPQTRYAKFSLLSVALHILFFAVASLLAMNPTPKKQVEVITVDFSPNLGVQTQDLQKSAKAGAKAQQQAVQQPSLPKPSVADFQDDVIVKKAPPSAKVAQQSSKVKKPQESRKATKATAKPVVKTAVISTPKASQKPQIAKSKAFIPKVQAVSEELEDFALADVDEDFSADQLEQELANAAQALEQEYARERANEEARLEAARVAAIQAREAQLAREKAEQDEAARQAAIAAKRKALFGRGSGDGDGQNPNGYAGALRRSSTGGSHDQAYGEPTGVRRLEQLKQIPGNPKPQYDFEDRRMGRQGNVVIYAYISREGYPRDFKVIQSSGHNTLDDKTLRALRRWKFYAGQEGWVEIPFNWSLKGGAEEGPSTLRRNLSSR